MGSMEQHEAHEVEVKALQRDFEGFPKGLLDAMQFGHDHRQILRRGPVEQYYIGVSRDLIKNVIDALSQAKVPFGTPAQQAEIIDNAGEVRVLIMPAQDISQITIKGQHYDEGMAVDQLETPGKFSRLVKPVVHDLNLLQHADGVVRKVWHDLKMQISGEWRVVEHDILTSHGGLMVVETEVPVTNGDVQTAKATLKNWIEQGSLPKCFQVHVTGRTDLKSSQLAFMTSEQMPADVQELLASRTTATQEIIKNIIAVNSLVF